MRIYTILLFCLLAGCARRPASTLPISRPIALLREGDILFQRLPCGSLCDAIVETTPCDEAYTFNHCGIFRYDRGQPVVVEAIGSRVQQTPLALFLKRDTASRLSLGRTASKVVAADAARKAIRYIGRPYDDAFLPGDSALYCSELVWESFQSGWGAIFQLQPMTFRSGGKTHAGWVEYYRTLGVAIPEGEPGINPCAIAGSEQVSLLAIPKAQLQQQPALP